MTRLAIALLILLGCSSLASADDVVLTWNANTETDLQGYRLYRGTVSGVYGPSLAFIQKGTQTYMDTVPANTSTVAKRYYYVLTAVDTSNNESGRSSQVMKELPAASTPVVVTKPSMPMLSLASVSQTSITVTYPPVADGAGGIAKVNIRFMPNAIIWGQAPSATCTASPCVITGLTPNTNYAIQAVAYRGTPNLNAVYGPITPMLAAKTAVPIITPPTGLTIVSQNAHEIVISSLRRDCRDVLITESPSDAERITKTIRCDRPLP